MRVLITGGSGFVGQRLCQQLLTQGHDVQVVSRSPHQVRGRLPKACDIRDSAQAFMDTPPEVLVNLAGESIAAKRWSNSQKETLIRSRIDSTQQLITLCEQLKANGQALPSVMISGSAMGYYGDQGDKVVDETTSPSDEFAHQLCAQWEAAAKPIEAMGVRLAILRIGLVLEAGAVRCRRCCHPLSSDLGGVLEAAHSLCPGFIVMILWQRLCF